uniref:Uncharacterized protein n=1 Tax=Arundo donax TaxID=35708 RepID=A0A0A8Y7M5_ARUDO
MSCLLLSLNIYFPSLWVFL